MTSSHLESIEPNEPVVVNQTMMEDITDIVTHVDRGIGNGTWRYALKPVKTCPTFFGARATRLSL